MNTTTHHVSGFFARREEAIIVLNRLLARGLPRARIRLFAADSDLPNTVRPARSNTVLKDVLVDASIGTAVGTGVGALAELALVAANVSLFIASPLIAPLVMLGWGASLGGLLGATIGAVKDTGPQKEGWFSDLVRDAIASGQTVLVVRTDTEAETAIAKEVIGIAVGEYQDVGVPA